MKLKLHKTQTLASQVETVAFQGVQTWLNRNANHRLIENMKDQSSYMIARLCRYAPFIKAVEMGDDVSIQKILNKACYNGQKLAYRSTQTKKVKYSISHDHLTESGFDPSIHAYNDDQELAGMPSNPFEAIEWVRDPDLVRSSSRLSSELIELLLSFEILTRQVIVLYWTTKYTAKMISVILEVSEFKVNNIAHRYMNVIKKELSLLED